VLPRGKLKNNQRKSKRSAVLPPPENRTAEADLRPTATTVALRHWLIEKDGAHPAVHYRTTTANAGLSFRRVRAFILEKNGWRHDACFWG
jgi:hypothetical protein